MRAEEPRWCFYLLRRGEERRGVSGVVRGESEEHRGMVWMVLAARSGELRQRGSRGEVAEEKGRGRGVVLLAGQWSRRGPGGKLRDTAAKNTAACRAGRKSMMVLQKGPWQILFHHN